jgi:hypothetical protein
MMKKKRFSPKKRYISGGFIITGEELNIFDDIIKKIKKNRLKKVV